MDVTRVPESDGAVGIIQPVNNFGLVFKGGEICTYRVMFPAEAGDFDQINLKLTKQIRTKIYVTEIESYSSTNYIQDLELE